MFEGEYFGERIRIGMGALDVYVCMEMIDGSVGHFWVLVKNSRKKTLPLRCGISSQQQSYFRTNEGKQSLYKRIPTR